jgi:PAS domain S-box-containing protein
LAALGLIALLCLATFAGASYVSALRWVDHTLDVLKVSDEWMVAVLDTKARARGYAFSEDPSFLGTFEASLGRERAAAQRLGELVQDNPNQLRNVKAADALALAAMQASQELVEAIRRGRRDEALKLFATQQSKQHTRAFTAHWREIQVEEELLLAERRSEARSRARIAGAGVAALGVFSLGLLLFAWRSQSARTKLLNRLAREARQRLRELSGLATELADARSQAEVARVVIERGMQIAEADVCTLYRLDETGQALELIADRGLATGLRERLMRITDESHNSLTLHTLRAGKSIWVEGPEDYARLFPALATAKVEGPRAHAFWSVPLIVEGQPAGLLGMGFYRERKFPPDERSMIETVAQQCAQALLRAERLEREAEARGWFTTTLRSIGDAVIATDDTGLVRFMNPVAEKLTGQLEDEARGLPLDQVFRIFSEHTRQPVESPVTKVLREGRVVGLANHTILRHKDGRDIPIDDSGAPIRSQDGALLGVVLVFRDVSREKAELARRDFLGRAGQVLVESLDFEVTLNTIAKLAVPTIADWCAVDVLDAKTGEVRQAAVAHVEPEKLEFARSLRERYPPNPAQPHGVMEVIRTGKAELYRQIPAGLLEAAAVDAEHLRLIRQLTLRSGMVVPLKVRGKSIGALTFSYAESGHVYDADDLAFAEDFAVRAGMALENSLVLKEVDEARALERRLRREAEVASRAKDEFLAMVSHELRTPLNAILGWAQILRSRGPDARINEGLAVIERNAHAQVKLIEDVLDVSRIIGGKLSLEFEQTDLKQVIESSMENVLPSANSKGISISVEVEEGCSAILADPHRLQQVLMNLLSNAVRFTPAGGRIWVRAQANDSEVRLEVEDNGEGIHRDALPFIFDAFRQADSSTTRRHGGLGLGLAIVKQIVTAHGGKVEVESKGEGAGARFIIDLPLSPRIGGVSLPVPRTPPPPPLMAAPRLDRLKLLVVDDEADARNLLREVLVGLGAEVFSASTARDAFAKFRQVAPDVIVSDISMPEEDGYSFIRKVRQFAQGRRGRNAGHRVDCLRAGRRCRASARSRLSGAPHQAGRSRSTRGVGRRTRRSPGRDAHRSGAVI